jgi:hypothetical protein
MDQLSFGSPQKLRANFSNNTRRVWSTASLSYLRMNNQLLANGFKKIWKMANLLNPIKLTGSKLQPNKGKRCLWDKPLETKFQMMGTTFTTQRLKSTHFLRANNNFSRVLLLIKVKARMDKTTVNKLIKTSQLTNKSQVNILWMSLATTCCINLNHRMQFKTHLTKTKTKTNNPINNM